MKVHMNLEQYKSYKNGEKTLINIKKENLKGDLGEVLKKKNIEKIIVISLALLLRSQKVYAADIIDNAGSLVLGAIQKISYFICIIFCLSDVLKCLSSKSTEQIVKTIGKYLVAYALIYYMPDMFDWIKTAKERFQI